MPRNNVFVCVKRRADVTRDDSVRNDFSLRHTPERMQYPAKFGDFYNAGHVWRAIQVTSVGSITLQTGRGQTFLSGAFLVRL